MFATGHVTTIVLISWITLLDVKINAGIDEIDKISTDPFQFHLIIERGP